MNATASPFLQPPQELTLVGGGLAGLSLAILLRQQGLPLTLLEKGQYPFHRVCGEYISEESWDFLLRLGIPLDRLNLPRLRRLRVSAPSGYTVEMLLDLGGFGISRYLLDHLLSQRLHELGGNLHTGVQVNRFQALEGEGYRLETSAGPLETRWLIGSFGKRSTLDQDRKTQLATEPKNYIGVKYHFRGPGPEADVIELHNFADGYAGISRIEDGLYCLCYLTTAENLRKNSGSIPQMEERILHCNPHLRHYFHTLQAQWERPLVISNVTFRPKPLFVGSVPVLGDAAGMITPLCGNGMSMAFRSAALLAPLWAERQTGQVSERSFRNTWTHTWQAEFATRLRVGRAIQSLFGHPWQTEVFLRSVAPFPALRRRLVAATHGQRF